MSVIRDRRIEWTLSFVATICFIGCTAQARYGGGTGKPHDPFLIFTPEQMNAVGAEPNDWDKHFKLMADIDLSGFDGMDGRPAFNIIASEGRMNPEYDWLRLFFTGTPFTGVFDGNGHTISHFTFFCTNRDFIGLFGYVLGPSGEIRNVRLLDAIVDGGEGSCVGGLVGCNEGAVIDCSSAGAVRGGRVVGGLVGSNTFSCDSRTYTFWRGCIAGCRSSCTVSGEQFVGGLAGYNFGDVLACCSTGPVRGSNYVGGLVGYNEFEGYDIWTGITWLPTVIGCYSVGAVSGGANAGGLVGGNEGIVCDCFWDTQTSRQVTSGGGTGKTTAEMQTAGPFLQAGWDFAGEADNGVAEIWRMPQGGGYPVLSALSDAKPGELSGQGTAESPYLVSTGAQLASIRYCDPQARYRLARDIDLSGTTWFQAVIPKFGGILDGAGFTVGHLRISGCGYLGLIGNLSSGGEVRDLRLVDAEVNGMGVAIGILAGFSGGLMTDCSAAGEVDGNRSVGGLVGENAGRIRNSYAVSRASAMRNVGGLAGANYGEVITCHSEGKVWVRDENAGGLIGANEGSIADSYSLAVATGNWDFGSSGVGGLAGGNRGVITRCFSAGMVSGWSCVGGVVGSNSGKADRCLSSSEVHGDGPVGGLVGYNTGCATCSYSAGVVSGMWSVGGLVGSNNGSVTSCYSIGDVDGYVSVGGLVGDNFPNSTDGRREGRIIQCYSTGAATGAEAVGGLVGDWFVNGKYPGEVTGCFWDIQTSGNITSAGGTGKTTAEMQTAGTFLKAGWDFVGETANGVEDTWWILEGRDYPRLWWELSE